MPELPEAETIVRGLRPAVGDRMVRQAEVVHADVLRVPPGAFRACVEGRTVETVARRGKNVVLDLDRDGRIVVNLGMTGRLLPVAPGEGATHRDSTHPAVVFHFEDGGALIYDDVRRFGAVECLDAEAWGERDRALGLEPLSEDFTVDALHDLLGRSRSPARSWLLDQRRVAGVGNIYAAEALFLAGVHPRRPANSLSREEAGRLRDGIRTVLAGAVRAGGTTIRDYRNAEGGTGEFVRQLAVYGREEEPCPRCDTAIVREVFGNRSAFLCPSCQPAG